MTKLGSPTNLVSFLKFIGGVPSHQTGILVSRNLILGLLHFSYQVIKPSMMGGFEKAALVARWAQQQGKLAVVSATFESGLGLASYIQFSGYLDLQNAEICRLMMKEPSACLAHGLGTYKWLKEDLSAESSEINFNSDNGFAGASVVDTGRFLQRFQVNQNVVVRTCGEEEVHNYQLPVDLDGVSYSVNVLEMGKGVGVSIEICINIKLHNIYHWILAFRQHLLEKPMIRVG